MTLVLYLKMYHHTQGHLCFSLTLSSRSFIVSYYTFRTMIHFQLIFVMVVRFCGGCKVSRRIFCMWMFSCSITICWRDCFCPIVLFLLLGQILINYVYVILFLGSYSLPLTYLIILLPRPHCLDYCSFIVGIKVG